MSLRLETTLTAIVVLGSLTAPTQACTRSSRASVVQPGPRTWADPRPLPERTVRASADTDLQIFVPLGGPTDGNYGNDYH